MQDTGMTHLTVEAAIIGKGITDESDIRFFDHELTNEKKTIPKHSPGISCVRGRRGEATQQERNNQFQDAPPSLGFFRSGPSLKGRRCFRCVLLQ
jgi:hypothetical protein